MTTASGSAETAGTPRQGTPCGRWETAVEATEARRRRGEAADGGGEPAEAAGGGGGGGERLQPVWVGGCDRVNR